MLPRRLSSLTAIFSAAFLIATIGTGMIVHTTTEAAIADLVDKRLADAVSTAVHPAAGNDPAQILRRMHALADERDTADIGIQLDEGRGRRLGGNIFLRRPLPVGTSTLRKEAGIPGLSEGRALVRVLDGGLRITAVAETEPFDHYNAARVRIYVFGFGSIVLVVVGGMIGFGLLVRRRITDMRRTVDAIVDGGIRQRVPVSGAGGVFDSQAISFNQMLDHIEELLAEIRNVSSDVAHDLRTPLARLRGRLALLARRSAVPENREDLEKAVQQCDELLAMFAAVLRIAEIEGSDRSAAFEMLDLSQLAADIVEMFQPVAADAGRKMIVGTQQATPILGDRQLLTQAIVNLIENALSHPPEGSRVVIATARTSQGATLSVTDDGPGIPADQRVLAMRRFGRLAGSRHIAGHGLGLPLVEAIARIHQGSLELADACPGLRVEVSIPLA